MYKTTKKDFEEFKKECEYWIEYFGLKNYEWHFMHGKGGEKNRASYWVNVDGRICTVELSLEWNFSADKNEIKKTSFHEVCEIMISPLSTITRHLYDVDFVEGKTHDIIRRLENTIFKEKRK